VQEVENGPDHHASAIGAVVIKLDQVPTAIAMKERGW
jgi:hypothetical protein